MVPIGLGPASRVAVAATVGSGVEVAVGSGVAVDSTSAGPLPPVPVGGAGMTRVCGVAAAIFWAWATAVACTSSADRVVGATGAVVGGGFVGCGGWAAAGGWLVCA